MVRVAWAMDGGRPVHIARYDHLRDVDDRPELTCLGCPIPVVPVLPLVGRGRPGRQDHFRHKVASPSCEAAHGLGAMLWNVTLHLHEALKDVADDPVRERLVLNARCDPAASRFQTDIPLFRTGCPRSRPLPLPDWNRAVLAPSRRGARAPEIQLKLGDRLALTLVAVPADPVAALKPLPAGPPRVEVHVDPESHGWLIGWNPRLDPEVPCSRATPELTWRCPQHQAGGVR